MLEILKNWLLKRAEEEQQKIEKTQMNFFSYFFASNEKKEKSINDANKSLGKLEFIDEIFNKIIEENKKENQ